MATYKAEFLAHYYKGRLRPRAAYSMGLIMWWAPLAMRAPGWANLLLHAPGIGDALKAAAGFTTEREAPAFAEESFQSWFHRQPKITDGSPEPVVLWPDTFNNYFFPGTAKSAVHVLKDAGYRVIVPEQHLCCGRPLYDYGMLDLAKRKLGQVIAALRPAIREGIPVVGLEPSCLSVFRDELKNMLPDDEDAQRLACQTKTISELLMATPDWKAPRLEAKALVQTHCHHKAVLDAETQQQMFEAMGLELQPNPTGCCGHAGSFGYETDHYPVSMIIAEQALLPAVRRAAANTLIIADGFSCREQIRHGARRNALHPVEILELALRNERIASAREIEQRLQQAPATVQPAASIPALAAIVAAAGLALWLGARNRSA